MASGAKMLYANNATITWPMQVLGRKDGADMIKKGEGFVFNKMFDSESSSDGGWISWFCDLEGHEFFVEVRI